MKIAALAIVLLLAALLLFGTPLAPEQALRAHYWGSAEKLLPMSFAHEDHRTQNCVACHHNYTDDTGRDGCMSCHVSDPRVSALLEEQFHTLCMGCHVEQQLAGEKHGPARQCAACHQREDRP